MLIKVGMGRIAHFAQDDNQRYVVFVIGVASELSPLGKNAPRCYNFVRSRYGFWRIFGRWNFRTKSSMCLHHQKYVSFKFSNLLMHQNWTVWIADLKSSSDRVHQCLRVPWFISISVWRCLSRSSNMQALLSSLSPQRWVDTRVLLDLLLTAIHIGRGWAEELSKELDDSKTAQSEEEAEVASNVGQEVVWVVD